MTKELGHIGDVNYVEYGGGPVYEDDDGSSSVEWIEPDEENFDEPGATWTVYRVELDQEIPDWIDVQDIANSVGRSWMEIASDFKSPDPMRRAFAYWDVAGYHGWHELDNYPLELGRAEVGARYDNDLYPLMPTVRERTDYIDGPQAGQITIDRHILNKAYMQGQSAVRVYEELSTQGNVAKPLENYYVLSFVVSPPHKAFVKLAYYEPDTAYADEPETKNDPVAKLKLKEQKLEREFPDLDKITPEEMLRRMSKWVPG